RFLELQKAPQRWIRWREGIVGGERRTPNCQSRRGRAGAHPLYRARTRAQAVVGQTEAGAARPTATENHRCACRLDIVVVPTFGGRLQQTQILRCPKMLESAKLG